MLGDWHVTALSACSYYLSGTDAFRLKLLLPPLLEAEATADAAEAEARRLEAREADAAAMHMAAMRVESCV